ncbi:hypothetical protein SHY80_09215, partial [Streptococcus suis]|nr:hypothetical protein [Streptococcus suis]
MWEKLKVEQKEKYRTLITNFASLSEAFSQKSETDEENETFNYVAPIINSKFQETVFQRAFQAVGEDIANTSFYHLSSPSRYLTKNILSSIVKIRKL